LGSCAFPKLKLFESLGSTRKRSIMEGEQLVMDYTNPNQKGTKKNKTNSSHFIIMSFSSLLKQCDVKFNYYDPNDTFFSQPSSIWLDQWQGMITLNPYWSQTLTP
jgi:hypothetical protein